MCAPTPVRPLLCLVVLLTVHALAPPEVLAQPAHRAGGLAPDEPAAAQLVPGGASQTEAAQWRKARSLVGLYERIAEDLKEGRPLVIAAYYGMWFEHEGDPDRNLNWRGGRYGHARMVGRARRDPGVARIFRHRAWRPVLSERQERGPLRTLVFAQRVRPGPRWRRLGVREPFMVYLAMQAFASREDAALRMTRNLRQDEGRTVTLDGGLSLKLGGAQVVAYFGHNLFYDYPGFEWDGLQRVSGRPAKPKGVAAVGCNTGRVPGFPALITPGVYALLLSRSLMASEGYSTLALADGVLRGLDSRALVRLADNSYRHFQTLARPRRVGRPFVSHGFRLYAE